MFIKLKDSFINFSQVFSLHEPDEDEPNGCFLTNRGGKVPLAAGEYALLSAFLLSTGAADLTTVDRALDVYAEAARLAPVQHALQTQAANQTFAANLRKENETQPRERASEPIRQEFRPQAQPENLPPTLTNRPGVFPDAFEDL